MGATSGERLGEGVFLAKLGGGALSLVSADQDTLRDLERGRLSFLRADLRGTMAMAGVETEAGIDADTEVGDSDSGGQSDVDSSRGNGWRGYSGKAITVEGSEIRQDLRQWGELNVIRCWDHWIQGS